MRRLVVAGTPRASAVAGASLSTGWLSLRACVILLGMVSLTADAKGAQSTIVITRIAAVPPTASTISVVLAIGVASIHALPFHSVF